MQKMVSTTSRGFLPMNFPTGVLQNLMNEGENVCTQV